MRHADLQRAQRLDPASPLLRNDEAVILHHGGRPAEAVALFEQLLAHDPAFAHAHHHLACALADLGEPERGLAALEEAYRLTARPMATSGHRARLLRLAGRSAEYERQRAAVLAAVHAGQADPMEAVWAVLDSGPLDETAQWLEAAMGARSRDVILVGHLPALAALRQHPRIAALLPG